MHHFFFSHHPQFIVAPPQPTIEEFLPSNSPPRPGTAGGLSQYTQYGRGYDDFLYGKTWQVLLSHFVSNTWLQYDYFNVMQVLSFIHYVYTAFFMTGRPHSCGGRLATSGIHFFILVLSDGKFRHILSKARGHLASLELLVTPVSFK